MSLRKYQQESLDAISEARARGVHRGLLVLPTGGGKTVVLAHIPESLGLAENEQMLVLVHRDELVWQTKEKLEKYNPGLHVSVEKAENLADVDAPLIVASVQTIGRSKFDKETQDWEHCERIQKFNRDTIRYIVVDEAHHSLGSSYQGILAYFGVLKNYKKYEDKDKYLLGVTATPNRGDNAGLESVFDEIIYNKPLGEMIDEGWLCDIEAYRIDTTVDITGVSVTKGDFAIGQLEKTVNTPERNKLIVDKYIELGKGGRAIAFTVDVQHSQDLAKTFNDSNIRSAALFGAMPKDDRRKTLQLFRDGYYRVLTSCGILNEGFDDPEVSVGLMARPTKSGLLYRQQVGRTLRPSPSPEEVKAMLEKGITPTGVKATAIIVDFCDLSGRHVLHTAPTLFGFSATFNGKGKKLNDASKEAERIISQKKLALSLDSIDSMERLKAISERVDLLAKPQIAGFHLDGHSTYRWIQAGKDQFSLSLPDYTILRVTMNMLGQYELSKSIKGIKTVLSTHPELSQAVKTADRMVPQDAQYLMSGTAPWRNKKVSDAQIDFLWKIDRAMRSTFPNKLEFVAAAKRAYPTTGAASDRISEIQEKRH